MYILPHHTMYSVCDSLTYFMLTWGVNGYSGSSCCRNGSVDHGDEGATTTTAAATSAMMAAAAAATAATTTTAPALYRGHVASPPAAFYTLTVHYFQMQTPLRDMCRNYHKLSVLEATKVLASSHTQHSIQSQCLSDFTGTSELSAFSGLTSGESTGLLSTTTSTPPLHPPPPPSRSSRRGRAAPPPPPPPLFLPAAGAAA